LVQRCAICGRHYRPDRRVGRRQRSCARPECRRERKRRAQQHWVAENPDYFQGRYEYVKAWRQRRREQRQQVPASAPEVIQDKIPPKNPYQQLVLLIPACRAGVIQDEIVLKRLTGSTFIAHGG
jgi:hypothetical protein